MKPTLGFIGLGLMGAPMAARLLTAGYAVHIHNRTKEKAAPLISGGAVWQGSPADVARHSEIVFTMLTNDAALQETADQILSSLRKNGIHVDCSTVSPALTSRLEREYSARGGGFLHCPVLGGPSQAAEGSLLLFAGGNDETFSKAKLVLDILGSKLWRFPAAAQATNTKIIMNSFIAGMAATLSQAMVYASKAGIDNSTILDILAGSALNAPTFQVKGKQIIDRAFAPRFFTENLLKDINLMIDHAAVLGAQVPVAQTVREMLERTITLGAAKEDYIAMIKSIE